MKRLLLLPALLLTVGCTDAKMAGFRALGGSADVVCHSGGKVIFEGQSTGKVESPVNSDGYQFINAKTGKLVEVSGNRKHKTDGFSK